MLVNKTIPKQNFKWVEASRTVTDITTLAVKIKNRGVQLVRMLVSMEFVKTAHALERNLRQVAGLAARSSTL